MAEGYREVGKLPDRRRVEAEGAFPAKAEICMFDGSSTFEGMRVPHYQSDLRISVSFNGETVQKIRRHSFRFLWACRCDF